MKKKAILYLVSLFFLSVPLTGRGQDKKAWEIGAGGSLINWSRVSVTGRHTSRHLCIALW